MKFLVLGAATLVLGCSAVMAPSIATTVIDGYTVGERRCLGAVDEDESDQCDRFETFALAMFERQHPGHSAIVATEVYRDPEFESPRDSEGHLMLNTYSGFADFGYVVLRQADGPVEALHIRVGAGVNGNICFLLPRDSDPTGTVNRNCRVE